MSTPSSNDTLNVVVRDRQIQGEAVAVLALSTEDGSPLPAFTAGAHVDVHLPNGISRSYSLCGDPASQTAYRLGILKDPQSRGGSVAVHDMLQTGTKLTISAPRNHFPLDEQAPYSVLVGGGIGVTPMLAMATRLHALGKPFELHYCARTRSQAAFLEELAQAPWADRVHLHFDDEGDAAKIDPGVVLRDAPAGRHLYTCGPAGFMDWVMAAGATAGLLKEEIHREYFSAPTQEVGANTSFEVIAKKSGKQATVGADQTLLQALKGLGIKISVSCEEGVCGTCMCTVLEGEPDHRDAYLTDEEREANDQILVCCSRSRSARLVLDV